LGRLRSSVILVSKTKNTTFQIHHIALSANALFRLTLPRSWNHRKAGSFFNHKSLRQPSSTFFKLLFASLRPLRSASRPFASLPSLFFPSLPFHSLPFPSLPFASLRFASLRFTSLPFASLPFASLRFPSLPFPALRFPSLPFPSLPCFTD